MWQQFKTPLVTVVVIFAALFVYTKLAGPIPFFINSITTTKTDLFTQEGQGQVTAVPDTATIDAGVTQTTANVTDAKNQTDSTVNKLITAVKKLGVSDNEIKTTNYSVNPNYSPNTIEPMGGVMIPGGNNNITGYTVTQNLEIKIKQTDKTNSVIDAVTANGANLVGGINFTFSDDLQNKLENQAREIAVAQAKNKAENLAHAAGLHLGRIVNVVENSNFPRIMPMAGVLSKTDQAQSSANVTPGENTVSITVTLYYETY